MDIIGHRGARGEAPENTVGGFFYLHSIGANAVEFDVRQLKDGNLVVMHDSDFERTTGICKNLSDCSLHEVKKMDHRLQWTLWPQPEPTPLLQEVLHVIKDFKHIELEIKSVANSLAAQRLIYQLLPHLNGFEQQITLTSFDLNILKCLKNYVPQYKRGLLVERDWRNNAVVRAQALGCERIGFKDSLATAARIVKAQQTGLKVSVWTVNSPQRASDLQQLGVDGLITDFPAIMLNHLQHRAMIS